MSRVIDVIAERRAVLGQQNPGALRLLAKLEWCIKSYPDMPNCCPCCMRFETSGHRADCELGNLLRKEREGEV